VYRTVATPSVGPNRIVPEAGRRDRDISYVPGGKKSVSPAVDRLIAASIPVVSSRPSSAIAPYIVMSSLRRVSFATVDRTAVATSSTPMTASRMEKSRRTDAARIDDKNAVFGLKFGIVPSDSLFIPLCPFSGHAPSTRSGRGVCM